MPAIVLYLLAAALVGFAGRGRRIGFIGFFLLSLLVTPIIGILIVFLSAPTGQSST
jgi:hypothetical protein